MAYMPHTYITHHGILGETATSPQTWSIGYRFPINEAFWVGYVADGGSLGDVAGDLQTAFTSSFPTAAFSSVVWLFGTKMAILDASGHYVEPPTEVTYSLTEAYGTTDIAKCFQEATVVTMRHIGTGRGNFGRVYLPPVQYTPFFDGLLSEVNRDTLAGYATDWLNAVNVVLHALDPDANVSIFSRAHGTAKTVQETAVGRVIDTQRRRRDKLAESLVYTLLD